MEAKSYYCKRCKQTMGISQFYRSNNLTKYPDDGIMDLCKHCLTAHVDNWDPDTYLWILKEVDVPYVPEEWNKLLARYAQDPSKISSTTIMGRYLSKMKLKQFKDYRWKDTEHLQNIAKKRIEEAMARQGFDQEQIDAVIEKGTVEVPERVEPPQIVDDPSPYPSNEEAQAIEDSLVADLTDEDRKYLCIKWGKNYRPEEWVRLEELYDQMIHSYDIQQAGDINTLKLACKSSLKANQLLDLGDIDGAQKAGKMYDNFMRSGKWTAAQNKTEENELIDSVGEIVAICETDGFIPSFYADEPKDKVDRVLQDMQKYTETLIRNETGLSLMLERAAQQIDEENARIKAAAEAGADSDEDSMFDYEQPPFALEDYSEFKDFETSLLEGDEE